MDLTVNSAVWSSLGSNLIQSCKWSTGAFADVQFRQHAQGKIEVSVTLNLGISRTLRLSPFCVRRGGSIARCWASIAVSLSVLRCPAS